MIFTSSKISPCKTKAIILLKWGKKGQEKVRSRVTNVCSIFWNITSRLQPPCAAWMEIHSELPEAWDSCSSGKTFLGALGPFNFCPFDIYRNFMIINCIILTKILV